MKNFCTTHHFHYTGHSCPFCEKDKIDAYTRKYVKHDKVQVHENINQKEKQIDEPSELQLNALMEKFNKR